MISHKVRGFSIIELLAVAAIFALVMAITSALFFRGRDAVAQSSDKVDTAGRARRTMDVLTPLVASAVETGGFEGIEVFDTTPLDLTDACHMDVTTRENFLAGDYTPTQLFDVDGPYFRFRVAYEPQEGTVTMYALKLVPIEIDDTVRPRLLARDVLGCAFRSVTVSSVAVSLETRAVRDDERRPGGVTKSRLDAILVAPGTR